MGTVSQKGSIRLRPGQKLIVRHKVVHEIPQTIESSSQNNEMMCKKPQNNLNVNAPKDWKIIQK